MSIKNILIVDDSKVEQMHLHEILSAAGFQCRTADSAEHAQLSIEAQRPDLILLDVVMPGQSGFQYVRALGKNPLYSDIPVVICSSKDQPTDRMWGIRQGARDYITKPIQSDELISKIRAITETLS
jgi:twitching motility two-component system response regulator PilH